MTLLAARNHPINCGLATSTFTRTFAKRPVSERKFDITATEIQRVTASPSESVVVLNKNGTTGGTALKNILRKSGATYVTDYAVSVAVRGEGYFQAISLSSDATGVLSHPSASGVATFQSSGDCSLRATSEDGEVALVKVVASQTQPATVDTFSSWATGSLARHCTDQINALTATKTQLNVFNQTSWFTPPDFVRNSQCWASGVDLSCASPWNNQAGALYAGTLISPRHVVFCEHASFYPSNGATITFVSAAGTVITRTVTSSVQAGVADIRVALLNADVSGGVTFAKVLPSNWGDYLPGLDYSATIPVLCLNQTERASISACRQLAYRFDNVYATAYPNFYRDIVLYDSGNPAFLIVNNAPVLLGVFSGGGAGHGAFLSYHASAVNAAMTALGGGYQLTTVDLSGFTNYA